LGLLRITKDDISNRNRIIKSALKEMSTVLILTVHNEIAQAVMPKNMILDLG